MPAFLIPIIEWIAQQVLSLIAKYVADEITLHKYNADQATKDSDENAAALAKLQAAQSKQDRIQAAKDALQGL